MNFKLGTALRGISPLGIGGTISWAKKLIQEARDTFEERRAAILNKAFTGELTKKWRGENPDVELELSKIQEIEKKPFDIPSSWKWVRLEEISELITKGSSGICQ